jgi:hypothetical protein
VKCEYPECEQEVGCYECRHCWIHCTCTTYYPSYDPFLEYWGLDSEDDDEEGWVK